MTKPLTLFILVIFTFLSMPDALAQSKVSNIDLSFQYDINSGLRGKIISSKQDSSAILLINFVYPLDSLKKYKVSYSLLNSLEEEVTSLIKLNNLSAYFQNEGDKGSRYGLKAHVGDSKYFVLWLSDTIKKNVYPYIKILIRNFQAEDFLLQQQHLNTAIFQSYISVNSTIRVKSISKRLNTIQADFYDYHFLSAKPPMSQVRDTLSNIFTVDKSIVIESGDSIQLVEKGLYYFHLDESKLGQSILVRDEKYPKVSHIDNLVESLRYLATNDEYEKMVSSFNKKALFDEFWLNNTKSEAKARRAIKEYYKRVKEANILFTTYKEGWKTDMGMIYIVFGAPSKAFVKNDGVMWIYSRSFELPRVAFFFKHINTTFSDQHYVLERKAEFQNLWFRTVDLWRSGKKEF